MYFKGELEWALDAVISGISGQALLMIGRWYSSQLLTNHN